MGSVFCKREEGFGIQGFCHGGEYFTMYIFIITVKCLTEKQGKAILVLR